MITFIAACAANIVLHRVHPTYIPAININGSVQRVMAVTIQGSPELLEPLKQRVKAEGWKVRPADVENCIYVDPAGHSLDEVTGLSFRVNNGEFGDLKFSVVLRPDGKTKR